MDAPAPPPSVLGIILEWSRDRPAWQRDALRRIVASGTPEEDAITELVALCKKGHGAADIALEPEPLEESALPANPGAGESISLISLGHVVGVNQLAPGQEIPFEPEGITVVYGDNGAGKSGYARVLKRACRARYPGEIMADAFNPPAAGAKANAAVSYAVAGVAAAPVRWIDDGKPHPVLSAVSVFDRECGAVHVKEKNEVAFRPFGLDIPDELAAVCQRVKAVLAGEQETLTASRDELFDTKPWKPESSVGKLLAALKAATAIGPFETQSAVPDGDRERHARLVEDLAKDPLKASAEQALIAGQLQHLASALKQIGSDTADCPLLALKAAADRAREARAAASLAAQGAFGGAAVEGVGGAVWKVLWDAAHHYAEHAGAVFPPGADETVCLLCHEPLTADARTRLAGFDDFIKADTEERARRAEQAFDDANERFAAKPVNARRYGDIRRRIALADPALGRAILRFLASARLRRAVCVRSLSEEGELALPETAPAIDAEVTAREASVRAYAAELAQAADLEGRKRLEAERDELGDRIALEGWLPKIAAEIERLKALALVEACLADTGTTAITRLGSDIADRVITPSIRDTFQDEIVRLAANRVRVEIVRSGGKYGSPQYQVRFFANAAAKVHNVLSEGEQTCVALAGFLTELATSPHRSTLVFDDPVSSLDHRWRNKVAERLVDEAAARQIIVFTHDQVFVHDLLDRATRTAAAVKLVTLSRGPAGAGIVSTGLPWMAAGVKDRVDKMEKAARQAKALYEQNDEDGYRDQAAALYSLLRSTWERAIEDVAFHGVVHRHRDYINTKNLRKATVLTEADCDLFDAGFQKCCDQTDAHDPSRGRNAAPPPPDELLQDIQNVLTWTDAIRERQKRIA